MGFVYLLILPSSYQQVVCSALLLSWYWSRAVWWCLCSRWWPCHSSPLSSKRTEHLGIPGRPCVYFVLAFPWTLASWTLQGLERLVFVGWSQSLGLKDCLCRVLQRVCFNQFGSTDNCFPAHSRSGNWTTAYLLQQSAWVLWAWWTR